MKDKRLIEAAHRVIEADTLECRHRTAGARLTIKEAMRELRAALNEYESSNGAAT